MCMLPGNNTSVGGGMLPAVGSPMSALLPIATAGVGLYLFKRAVDKMGDSKTVQKTGSASPLPQSYEWTTKDNANGAQ